MKKAVLALLLATGFATPALADPPKWSASQVRYDDDRGDRGRHRDWRDDRRDREHRGSERRSENRRDWERRGDDRREWERDRARRDWERRDRDRREDWRRAQRYDHRWDRGDWRRWNRYDWNRPDPRYGRYYADRYYRDGRYYGVRELRPYDRIYRGYDGRYYCRRSDGTTGLLIGALGGGLLGDALAPGDSRTVGALIGGGLGALIGREIDRGGARCR